MENDVVMMLPASSSYFQSEKNTEALDNPNVDGLVRKTPLPIPEFEPSSKIRKVDPNGKMIEKIDSNGLLATSKPTEVVSFGHGKSTVSYEPNAETTSVRHKANLKNSPAMDWALKIQANLPSKFPSFVKTMLASQVLCGFTMNFPKNFTDQYLPKNDESTVLLVDESDVEYKTKYLARKFGLSSGWSKFSKDHKLQEQDVLVFHLIQQCKFKVYIVRANASTEFDGNIGFPNMGACVEEMDNDHQEKDLKITEMAQEKHLEQYSSALSVQEKAMVAVSNDVDAAANHVGMDTDNYCSEEIEGIRFSESVVDFKDMKSFENFNIVVDGMIIDCEIPQHNRVKYFELCCSQKSYLHDKLTEGLNLHLVVGFISETINIADAIRSSKSTACCENLKIWDKTLKAFEDLGMKVGFLRARINKLLTFSSDLKDALKCKELEKVKAEEESKALEMKLSSIKEVIEKLDAEIEDMKMKDERLKAVFMEEAKAPW